METTQHRYGPDGPGAPLSRLWRVGHPLLAAHGRDGFRLVLCDALSRPSADIFVWLDEVRCLTGAPAMIASGYPATAFTRWAEGGFATVLPKPFDVDDLSALVVGLCGRPEQER